MNFTRQEALLAKSLPPTLFIFCLGKHHKHCVLVVKIVVLKITSATQILFFFFSIETKTFLHIFSLNYYLTLFIFSLNYTLVITKFSIYNSCLRDKKLTFDSFLALLKERLNIQCEITIVHNKISTFNKPYKYLL